MAKRRRRSRGFKNGGGEILVVLFIVITIVICFVLSVIATAVDGIISFVQHASPITNILLLLSLVGAGGVFVISKIHRCNAREEEQKRIQIDREREEVRQLSRFKNLDLLRAMDPFDFEQYIARLFTRAGFRCEVTKRTGDGGKDIIVHGNDGIRLIECKRYSTTKVGRPDIQKFHSATIEMNAKEGYFITTGDFTKQAWDCAKDKSIQTINGQLLLDLIEEIVGSDSTVL